MLRQQLLALIALGSTAIVICSCSTRTNSSEEFQFISDMCGPISQADTYRIKAGDLNISLPMNAVIKVRHTVLHSDRHPAPWLHPQNRMDVAVLDKLILIRTTKDDCVDHLVSDLFVLSRSGELLKKQKIWTAHWNDGFYLEGEKLVYRSDWFCHPENKDRKGEKSYNYSWKPGESSFERNELPASDCRESAVSQFHKTKIVFSEFTPENPSQSFN